MVYALPHRTRSCGPSMRRSVPRACGPSGGLADATEFYRPAPRGDGRGRGGRLAGAVQPRRTLRHPARHEPEAPGRARLLRRVSERAAAGRDAAGRRLLTADQVAAKINGMQRGEVPVGCNHLTMFIDVQADAAVLRRGRLGGRFHRLRARLRHLSRPEAAVLHAPRCPADAVSRSPRAPAWRARSTPGWRR